MNRNESVEKGVEITLAEPAWIVEGFSETTGLRESVNQRSKLRHTRLFETGAIVSPHCSAAITRDCRQSCRGHNKTYGIGEPRGVAASRRDASRRPRAAERRNLSTGVEKKFVMRELKEWWNWREGNRSVFSKMKDEMESIMEEQKLLFNCFFLVSYRHLFFSWERICVSFRFWILFVNYMGQRDTFHWNNTYSVSVLYYR